MADSIIIVRIDADEHPELCRILKVDALPALQLYRNKALEWQHTRYIEKSEVVARLTGIH